MDKAHVHVLIFSVFCSFIEYCSEKGCYTGTEYMPEPDMLEDILQRLHAVCLDKDTDSGSSSDDNDDDDDGNVLFLYVYTHII